MFYFKILSTRSRHKNCKKLGALLLQYAIAFGLPSVVATMANIGYIFVSWTIYKVVLDHQACAYLNVELLLKQQQQLR